MKRISYLSIFLLLVCVACAANSTANTTPTAVIQPQGEPAEKTPTPTVVGGVSVTPTQSVDICEGLGGSLEMQVLVGPAEAVGLEPVAVGSIPFSVISDGGVNIAQGNGSITYQDVLAEAWGTYTVNLDMQASMGGECETNEQNGVLNFTVTMSGEQLVEVEAQGFQGSYPWSGTHDLSLSFPIVEGATAQGEGWVFVLHLNE
jgi:hypothetical protein